MLSSLCAMHPAAGAQRAQPNWKLTQGEAGAASGWMQPLRAVAWRKDPGPRHLPTQLIPEGLSACAPSGAGGSGRCSGPFSRYQLRIVGASFQAPEQEENSFPGSHLHGRASGASAGLGHGPC
ncbi:chromodomain-helicase-DNA-binding protein 3 [Platysternon megacephalum]|uniref:Chromodomain-helicase-DNA-binding protein 3 n=1 Tax=Platysternon megacephalum TaxID=55544 RepID=A0A4D9DLT5_9SAUR|nr:chromodomain-helicase-DNA-binding protein 3 [Platysternon megacephalum]